MSLERQAHDGWKFYENMIKPMGVERGELFEERAVSAFKIPLLERPAGKMLNIALMPGDHVVFLRLDRAFRRIQDMANTCPLWIDRGVHVHFISPAINLSTAQGKLVAHVIAAVVEWESAMKSERVREAMAFKKKHYPMKPHSRNKARPWLKALKPASGLMYVADVDRFEEAMLALRNLAAGGTFAGAAKVAEKRYREVMGLPPKAKFLEKDHWTYRMIQHLAKNIANYLPMLRNYYGERDEYYLDLSPEGCQRAKIPPVPRPPADDDASPE